LLLLVFGAGCSAKIYQHPSLVVGAGEPSGELVFIRKKSSQGGLNPMTFLLNREKVVRLGSGNYTSIRVTPGVYSVEASIASGERPPAGANWVAGIQDLQVDSHRTYFILAQIAGRTNYAPIVSCDLITEEGGRRLTQDYKRIGGDE
jgi:hypothetical protein